MGDAAGLEEGDGAPGALHLVGRQVVAPGGQRASPPPDRGRRARRPCPTRATTCGLGDPQAQAVEPQAHQRGALGGLLDGHEQLAPGRGAGAEAGVQPGDGVTVAVAVAAHVDREVDAGARGPVGVGDPRRGVLLGQHREPHAGPPQRGRHGRAGGGQVGRPHDQQRRRTARHAHAERHDEIEGQVRARHHADDGQHGDRRPQRAGPPWPEPPHDDHHGGHRAREVGRGGERPAGDPALAGDDGLPRRGLGIVDDVVAEQRRHAGGERGTRRRCRRASAIDGWRPRR